LRVEHLQELAACIFSEQAGEGCKGSLELPSPLRLADAQITAQLAVVALRDPRRFHVAGAVSPLLYSTIFRRIIATIVYYSRFQNPLIGF
jgi:hypothetical protein